MKIIVSGLAQLVIFQPVTVLNVYNHDSVLIKHNSTTERKTQGKMLKGNVRVLVKGNNSFAEDYTETNLIKEHRSYRLVSNMMTSRQTERAISHYKGV